MTNTYGLLKQPITLASHFGDRLVTVPKRAEIVITRVSEKAGVGKGIPLPLCAWGESEHRRSGGNETRRNAIRLTPRAAVHLGGW